MSSKSTGKRGVADGGDTRHRPLFEHPATIAFPPTRTSRSAAFLSELDDAPNFRGNEGQEREDSSPGQDTVGPRHRGGGWGEWSGEERGGSKEWAGGSHVLDPSFWIPYFGHRILDTLFWIYFKLNLKTCLVSMKAYIRRHAQ